MTVGMMAQALIGMADRAVGLDGTGFPGRWAAALLDSGLDCLARGCRPSLEISYALGEPSLGIHLN